MYSCGSVWFQCRHLLGGTAEEHETLRIIGVLVEIQTDHFPYINLELYL
jgi:hypothetical protein